MKRISTCPSCTSKKIRKVRRKWAGKYKGEAYTIAHLEFYECPDCGEQLYDREAMRTIEAHSPAFAKTAAGK